MKNKHPAALFILSFAEMWERFGFYIIEGLLILYMTKDLNYSDTKGYAVLGAFTALAFMMPIFGGIVADQVLGFRRTILFGNILLVIGYGLLVVHSQAILYPALALIVMGTGFFKPNTTSYLGVFYKRDDPLRESGYTIYYMVFNFGILLATTISGFVQKIYGWHITFGMACLGMLVGLFTVLLGMKRIPEVHQLPSIKTPLQKILKNNFGLLLAILLLLILSWVLIVYNEVANLILWSTSLIIFVTLLYNSINFSKEARNKFFALIFLVISSIVFWAVFFQMFFSLNLFIDRLVNRKIFGFEVPTVMFLGLEALFIFILGPIFAYIWHSLNKHKKNTSIGFKFALATFCVGIAFLWILIGIKLNSPGALLNPIWIVLAYLFVTIGEMLLSPIGLAAVTILSPANWVGMIMGMWFVSCGLGGKLAGIIANLSSIPKDVTNSQLIMSYYQHAFLQYFLFAVIVGGLILLLTPVLRIMERGGTPTWKQIFAKKMF